MTKIIQLLLVLGLFSCAVHGQDALFGFNFFDTYVDGNMSCQMHLDGLIDSVNNDILLQQAYQPTLVGGPQPIPAECHYHNWVLTSLFNEQIDYNIVWQNNSNGDNTINSTFFPSALQATNGSACVLLPQTSKPAEQQYLCHAMYDVHPYYFIVWGTGNFSIDNSSGPYVYWVQSYDEARSQSMQLNNVTLNTSFPAIVANLWSSCNSMANVSALTQDVTVSVNADLSANIGGVWLAYTIIKQNGHATPSSDPGNYRVVVSQSTATLFNSPSSNSCWDLLINYSDILPDMDYCANGCEVSFIFRDQRSIIYVMKTSGLWTVAPSTGGNSSGGNSTGGGSGTGGSGSGTGGNGGVGTGGNGGSAASSGLAMTLNVFMVMVSVVYLIWQ